MKFTYITYTNTYVHNFQNIRVSSCLLLFESFDASIIQVKAPVPPSIPSSGDFLLPNKRNYLYISLPEKGAYSELPEDINRFPVFVTLFGEILQHTYIHGIRSLILMF